MLERTSSTNSTYQNVKVATNSLDSKESSTNIEGSKPKVDSEERLNPNEKDKVAKVVDSLNDFLIPSHTSLKFEFHDKLNEYYVTLVDDNTKEVVKEIPSKKMLDFYAAMTEFIGVMIDKKI
ncbi:flagellar protein FlaG [Robertmurraya korlensis]|uniref:flagellar protein FlaG n=1 Tax=Robertmurraya korlensis TaxID=519977 RepID=UPI00082633B5|nr:flagellar protein FlaG [Robertmurraya korlensis]